MLNFIFNIKKNSGRTIITILGFKIKLKSKETQALVTLEDLRAHTLALRFHPSLEKYRGIFTNKDVVIIGGGPSLKYYEPMHNVINIGINRAYLLEKIKFDYLFAQDNFPVQEEIEDFIKYRQDECIKFIGLHTVNKPYRIRPSTIARIKNKEIYILNNRRPQKALIPIDITAEPFSFYAGTVFGALQLALFANARKIYLVGFDCNIGHYFDKDSANWDLTVQYKYWHEFKKVKDAFYENNKIISVNPINLKGLFNDVYTQSYVDAHPELKNENIEIL